MSYLSSARPSLDCRVLLVFLSSALDPRSCGESAPPTLVRLAKGVRRDGRRGSPSRRGAGRGAGVRKSSAHGRNASAEGGSGVPACQG